MKDYLKDVSDKILNAHNVDLTLLRWLVSYHSHSVLQSSCNMNFISYDWDETKREEMKKACQKCKIVDEETGNLSDLGYAQKIYEYGQSIIVKFAQNEREGLSEYSILLYIYTLAITSNTQKSQYSKANRFGKCLLRNIELYSEPSSILMGDFLKCSAVDRLIFVLYLWIADLVVLNKYNEKICKISESKRCNIDADKIYDRIYKLSSKIKYFYNNRGRSKDTENKIHENFKLFVSNMPPEAIPFAPSIITIFFNSLLPTRIARAKEIDFRYANLKREINFGKAYEKKYCKQSSPKIKFPEQDDSSFLKMLILPEDGTDIFDKNKKNRIESRFIEYEWECFCKTYQDLHKQVMRYDGISSYPGVDKHVMYWDEYGLSISEYDIKYCNNIISKYIKAEKLHTPTLKEYNALDRKCKHYIIKAMRKHSFTFTYSYFEMFCKLVENKKLFSSTSTPPVDIALSMIHLNTFTKWYDAVLLYKGMHFAFLECNYFFYLKMLAVYEKYARFVEGISCIDRNVLYGLVNKSIKKAGRETNISCEDTFEHMLQFFYDLAETKINSPKLMNIFKSDDNAQSNRCRTIGGFDPIYQWIKLLDDKELKEEFFDNRGEEHPSLSVWGRGVYSEW